jgi:hypothetical protein
MANGLKLVGFGGFLLGIYYFMRQNVAISNLKLVSVSFQKFAWQGLSGEITVHLNILNPSPSTINFSGFSGSIFTGVGQYEKELFPCSIAQTVSIKPRQKTALPVVIEISALSLGANLFSMIQSKQWIRSARIKGNILVNGSIQMPVNMPIV